MDEFGPIVAGFLLTTVLGGLLATYLQNRSWSHQYAVQSAAKENERAVAIFEEVSRLLDRRLYRMRRIYWALSEDGQSPPSRQTQKRMDDYVTVLYQWNDSINRNLALIQRYFGTQSREVFDNQIGAQMRNLGIQIEELWLSHDSSRVAGEEIETALTNLGDAIYNYNLQLLDGIQAQARH